MNEFGYYYMNSLEFFVFSTLFMVLMLFGFLKFLLNYLNGTDNKIQNK